MASSPVEVLRRNNTSAVMSEQGEVKVTIGGKRAGQEADGSFLGRSYLEGEGDDFDVSAVRPSPKPVPKSVGDPIAQGETQRAEEPYIPTSTTSFQKVEYLPSEKSSTYEPSPAVSLPTPATRRQYDYASTMLNEQDFYSKPPSTTALVPVPPPDDHSVIASRYALSKLHDQSVSYFDPEMSVLSPYRRTTKAHLIRPFVAKHIAPHIFTARSLPKSQNSTFEGSSLSSAGSPKIDNVSNIPLPSKAKEELFDYNSLEPSTYSRLSEKETSAKAGRGWRSELDEIFADSPISKRDISFTTPSTQSRPLKSTFDDILGNLERTSFLDAEDDSDLSAASMSFLSPITGLKRDKTRHSDVFSSNQGGRINDYKPRFGSKLAQQAYESRLGDSMISTRSTSPINRAERSTNWRATSNDFLHAKEPSRIDTKRGLDMSSMRSFSREPSRINVANDNHTFERSNRVRHDLADIFSAETLSRPRDSLVVDLDRFKYVPQSRGLKFAPNQEIRVTGSKQSSSGDRGHTVQRGFMSTLRESRHFQKQSGSRVKRSRVINDDDEVDDIGQIAKHVMDDPFGTLEALRVHFVKHDGSLSTSRSKYSEAENKSKTTKQASISHSGDTVAAQAQEEIARLKQQLNVIQIEQEELKKSRTRTPVVASIPDASFRTQETPQQSSDVDTGLKMLTRGSVFIKTTSRGSTHRRFVFVSPDMRTLFWAPPDSIFTSAAQDTRSMTLVGARVMPGQQTIPFQRRNEYNLAYKCFSIVTSYRSLDLEIVHAETASEGDVTRYRDEWVDAFKRAIAKVTPREEVM